MALGSLIPMTTLNPPINGIASCAIIDHGGVPAGLLIDCYDAVGASLGRRFLPGITDSAGIPAALEAGVNAPLPAIETIDTLRATLKARASTRRWEVETAGVTLPNGLGIDTDDRTKVLISGALASAQLDAGFTTRWKASDGTWHDLDADMIRTLATAIFRHVDSCFAREGELHDWIDTAPDRPALESLRPAIERFWP